MELGEVCRAYRVARLQLYGKDKTEGFDGADLQMVALSSMFVGVVSYFFCNKMF
jgi:hypothetical protein